MNEPSNLPVPMPTTSSDLSSTQAPIPAEPRRATSRRRFLTLCGLGAGGLAGAAVWGANSNGDGAALSGALGNTSLDSPFAGEAAPTAREFLGPATAADPSQRKLVIVELSGGNDGLATLLPMGDGRLHDLRPGLLPEDGEVHWLDDRSGLHPALATIAGSLAVLQGVGTADPSGSHFEMEERWWKGQVTGDDLPATGFLGRLCDFLDDGAPVTGVAIGRGMTRALISDRSVTLGIPDLGSGWFLTEPDKWFRNLRQGLADLGTMSDGDGELVDAARDGLDKALDFASVLEHLEVDNEPYPGGSLSDQLAAGAALLSLDTGVRVIHVQLGGFDTHGDQLGSHNSLMTDFDGALGAFLGDLDRRGLADQVLVATTSEFGRRPSANDGGTDHGAASVAMLAGPVRPGLHGEPLSLTSLDDDDNLVATTMFDEYYATLAESWFEIAAGDVLDGSPSPIGGILAT